MFRKPLQQTLKLDHTSRVSRCAVCQRRRVSEEYVDRLKPHRGNTYTPRGYSDPERNRYPEKVYPDANEEEERTNVKAPPRSRNQYPEWQRYSRPEQQRSPYRRVPPNYQNKARVRKAGTKT